MPRDKAIGRFDIGDVTDEVAGLATERRQVKAAGWALTISATLFTQFVLGSLDTVAPVITLARLSADPVKDIC